MARSDSRFFMVSRLSYFFFPFARPIVSFMRRFLVDIFKGMSAVPFFSRFPLMALISFVVRSSLRD